MVAKDGGAGARHLSSNRYIHHYYEGAAEKLDSWFAEYQFQAEKAPHQLQDWISQIAKVRNSRLGQIFNHPETLQYIAILRDFRPHFNDNTYFSMAFCADKLHNVNGAVSRVL
jgi:hypothetical protein